MRKRQGQEERPLSRVATGVTVNVEVVQLGPDVLILCHAMPEQLFLDGLHYSRGREVELDGEIQSIHLTAFR